MDSNSLDKALNSILNTLPRTVAPLGAISYSVKKIKETFDNFFFFQKGQWIKKPVGIFVHIFFVFQPIFLKFSAKASFDQAV